MRRVSKLILVMLGFVMCLASGQEKKPFDTAALKSDLETVYNTWRQSMVRADLTSWKQMTASFRQAHAINLATSEKKPFPDSMFNQPYSPPTLGGMTFVGIMAKNSTVAVTYVGKPDWGTTKSAGEDALVLLFVREANGWKYDQFRYFNLAELPEVRKRLVARDRQVLVEQDGFQPTGVIPPVEKLCARPKYVGKIFVDCQGREVVAKVNGISTHEFSDKRGAETIIGGLHDGANKIEVAIKDCPNIEKGRIIVEVFLMPESDEQNPVKLCSYVVNKGDALSPTPKEFVIDQEKLKLRTYVRDNQKEIEAAQKARQKDAPKK